jgi:hypothetical protein
MTAEATNRRAGTDHRFVIVVIASAGEFIDLVL